MLFSAKMCGEEEEEEEEEKEGVSSLGRGTQRWFCRGKVGRRTRLFWLLFLLTALALSPSTAAHSVRQRLPLCGRAVAGEQGPGGGEGSGRLDAPARRRLLGTGERRSHTETPSDLGLRWDPDSTRQSRPHL